MSLKRFHERANAPPEEMRPRFASDPDGWGKWAYL